ncbi:Crp/Fnr family transcriptional regulator [Pedobacter faecalis]|uniref:Crp/Fnr family transcriptional regulator n=1 Tax=Pedobacter faecalis TaxID=3041495 RepID=UPI00254DF789|nr:Crp/Fnr family transcriptional regulator [Pedobacter sp. ELA7]
MARALVDYVSQFGHLSDEDCNLISATVTKLNLKKDEYFSEAGKVPRQVGFILEGVIRGCYYDNKGEEITRCFISENNLVSDYMNLEAGFISTEYLQACTPCSLIIFSKDDWHGLSDRITGWENIKNKMVHACMFYKSRKAPVISQDATTRYLEFLENHPSLANRVPLAYIASYLGVTQQSLSRIRRQVR